MDNSPLSKPPDHVWQNMTEEQKEQWRYQARLYADLLKEEKRAKYRHKRGY